MGLVLIADDNPHAHRMGRQILSQEGHDVVTVASGDEAMEYLSSNRPDLVMVDTRMPGPSGYEVCRRVKQDESLDGVKAVLLAGPLEPFDSDQAKECGSDAVLHKPLDAFTLIDTVNSLIGKPDPSAVHEEAPEPDAAEAPAEEAKQEPPRAPADLDEIRAAETWGGSEAPATAEEIERTRQERLAGAAVAESDDPFADLVRDALSPAEDEAARREKIRATVAEAVESALPALIDVVTDRVIAQLEEE